MKIADFTLKRYSINTTSPIRTSTSEKWKRDGMIIIIRSQDGAAGLGEIAPLDGYSRESLSEAQSCASTLAKNLLGVDIPESITEISSLLINYLPECNPVPSSIRFGFETAISDLISRSSGMALCDWLSPDSKHAVPVNALVMKLGMGAPPLGVENDAKDSSLGIPPQGVGHQRLIDEVNELVSSGYTCLKLKVSGHDLMAGVKRIAQVRVITGDHTQIRLDANRSWNLNQATWFLREVNKYRIEYIEEPLVNPDIKSFETLFDSSGVAIAIDETVQDIHLWTQLISCHSVEAVVIKPTIVGGISASLSLMKKGIALGKKVVVSSTFETGVGLAACLHLAATLGEKIQPCGFDTIRYLTENMIDIDLNPHGGFIDIPGSSGLGVNLDYDSEGWL